MKNEEPLGNKTEDPFDPREQKVFLSEDLFGNKKEIFIKHAAMFYRLLTTKSGKLILNK